MSNTISQTKAEPPNHPLAVRMGVFAFLVHNIMLACVFGPYGVLIRPLEARMGVTREVSSLGIPLVLLAIALLSPVIGVLVGKLSLRLLMIVGAGLSTAGFALLAAGGGVPVFLVAYGLLIGPAMAINGTMLPPTLVTRWFNAGRGRALGFAHTPLVLIASAPLVTLILVHYGVSAAFGMLAAVSALMIVPALFVVDRPPQAAAAAADDAQEATAESARSVGELLRDWRFWLLVLAYTAVITASSAMGAHLAPMVIGWGVEPTRAAALISASSVGGMIASPIMGWLAERAGGALAIALACLLGAALWTSLLLHPAYGVLVGIAFLIGLASGGIVSMSSMAVSQIFGRESFSRAFGLCNLINLPLMVLGSPVAAHIYVVTGSYDAALAGFAALALLGAACGVILALDARRRVVKAA